MMRAHFDVLFGRERRMKARRIALLGAALLALAACSKTDDPGYQGWVEADLIFVSPDEAGRVETLSVREGDAVETGAPLFAVDPDLQQADVDMAKASVTNATQAYRARAGVAQDRGRHAEDGGGCGGDAAHRAGAAQFRADAAGAPQDGKPGERHGAADLLPAGRMVPAGRPVVSLLPPGNIKMRFFVPETVLPKIALGQAVSDPLRRLQSRRGGEGDIHLAQFGIHAAGDLQPR